MAVRAQVVGARYFHLAHRRQHRLGAQIPVVGLAAARTRDGPLVGGRGGELQEFGQSRGSGLMHGRTHSHLGGDEVNPEEWKANPAIQSFMQSHHLTGVDALQGYFTQRVQQILEKHGKHMVGWDEILRPDIPKNILIQSWRGQKSLAEAARSGYHGILSAGWYLDLMQPASQHYAVDPLKGETVGLSDAERQLILGGEAAMWEEIATAENLDAKLWPRLAAIAERLWSAEK